MLCCASESLTVYFMFYLPLLPSTSSLVLTTLFCFSIISRIAKNALSLRERFDTVAQTPEVYLNFYGGIAWRFETFQVCADYLCRGFETGLSTGNTHAAWLCALQATLLSIISGANLKSLLNKIDYYLHLSKTFNIEIGKNLLLVYRESLSILIDKGEATGIEAKPTLGDINDPGNKLRVIFYRHEAVRAFWLGYTERCQHCCQKILHGVQDDARLLKFQLEFYYGKEKEDVGVQVMLHFLS